MTRYPLITGRRVRETPTGHRQNSQQSRVYQAFPLWISLSGSGATTSHRSGPRRPPRREIRVFLGEALLLKHLYRRWLNINYSGTTKIAPNVNLMGENDGCVFKVILRFLNKIVWKRNSAESSVRQFLNSVNKNMWKRFELSCAY